MHGIPDCTKATAVAKPPIPPPTIATPGSPLGFIAITVPAPIFIDKRPPPTGDDIHSSRR
ncbi:hypothetical protein llg_45500 [Luteolibacter sp. LG18]|nr:hypothetical protein llg_45500 [Luteolibacter sp. LG18]